SSEWSRFQSLDAGATDSIWTWALVNPRGIGFVAAIAAAVAATFVYPSGEALPAGEATRPLAHPVSGLGIASFLGVFAHLTGLALVTSEVYAQGIIRHWDTGTSL